tara:strand:- start:111 stop:2465 length:2355 start_codon:yes stop_codon:yes gene_type:complete
MKKLGDIVEHYGSDKVASGYVLTYEKIFSPIRESVTSILEIGIGTLDYSYPSTFGGNVRLYPHYKPGGSLRTWRDYFPQSQVYGIDIADDCMFTEERIQTFQFDSSNKEKCEFELKNLEFDIIIDDGNHDPAYQIKTLINLFPLLKPNGIYIIEDIGGYSGTEEFLIDYLTQFKEIIGEYPYDNKGNHIVITKTILEKDLLTTTPPNNSLVPNISENKNNELTLVTGLWDIGRDERSFKEHYLPNFEKFLKINQPMVIFIPKSLEEFVLERRDTKNTFIKLMELEDIKNLYSPFWNQTQKIRTDENWLKITGENGWLPLSPQAKLEYYNPIVMSKMFMLHDASIWNPFDTDYFFWLDAGITNTVHEGALIDLNLMNQVPQFSNPFLFLSYPYEHSGEVHGFEGKALEDMVGEKFKYVCRGGLFGGHKDQIREANATYYSILLNTLNTGLMGTEETIFSIMAYQEPYLYRRFGIKGDGMIQEFMDHLHKKDVELIPLEKPSPLNLKKITDNNINQFKTNLYILTFNFPEQLLHTIESMKKVPEWLEKPYKILLDNSTDEEARIKNQEIAKEYNFKYISLEGNTGICGGRQAAAEHFHNSDADYYFFFEDDMTSNPPEEENKFCRNGLKKFIPNLYNILHKIIIKEDFDYLKLSFTEVFWDNNIQTSWYNVPQDIRTKFWPDYDQLPPTGNDPNAPKTQFNNISVLDNISYIDGEITYSNWPMIMSKKGNKKVFIDTTWSHPYEQTWMSYVFQEQKKGNIKSAVLLASPIWHDRIKFYKPEERREN